MELNIVDVVPPLENLTAKALVVSEGVSLLEVDSKEKGPGFGAVEGAAAEPVGLKDGVELVACASLLLLL